MKLSSPVLERNLRRQARREMRESATLWREYQQHRSRWWERNRSFQAVLPTLAVLGLLWTSGLRSGRPLDVLTVIALYAAATTLLRSAAYCGRVLRGFDRAVLINLPIGDDDYLRHELRTLFRSWAGAFAVFLLAYGGYALINGDLRRDWVFLLVAAILQTSAGLSLGSTVLAYRPKWAALTVVAPLYGMAILCPYLPASGAQFLWSASLITPAGWVAHGFAGLVGAVDSGERFWLIPAFAVSAALPVALGKLQSRLRSELALPGDVLETILEPERNDIEHEIDFGGSADAVPPVREDFSLGGLSARPDWRHLGWIERLVAAWFTDREKVVAEFMLTTQLGTWSKRWRVASIITAAGAVCTLVVPVLPPWIFLLPMAVAGMMAAPILGGCWTGFRGPMTSGFVLPAYSVFPLGYAEITRVMLKANLVRAVTWAPLAVVYVAALAQRQGSTFEYGALIGLDVVLILIALQPITIMGHFSSGTNDTKQIHWQNILFFGMALVFLIVGLVAGFMIFIVPTLLVHVVALAGMVAISTASWAAYKVLFERGRIDLLSRPRGH